MSDLERLLAAFESGALLRPSALVENVVDLSRALATVAGVKPMPPSHGSPRIANMIGNPDHLVFVLADGLGLDLVESLAPDAFLRTHLAAELQTVFPSATASAVTSFATGEWPGIHGITGWWTHLPQLQSAVAILPFVSRGDGRPLAELGVTPEQAFIAPSWMSRVPRDTLALFPEQIVNGAYSAYTAGGKPTRAYRTLGLGVDMVIARVSGATDPTYTYLYTPHVDNHGHMYGALRSETVKAVRELEAEMARLSHGLAKRGRLVLSADHGLLDAPSGAKHRLVPSYDLTGALRFPPSGDARVLFFHLKPGGLERVRESLRRSLGESFLVISVEEAEELKLFGPDPIAIEARHRLGDMVAISRGADVVEYQPSGVAGRVTLEASQHSGLSPAEMRVPLVLA